MDNIIQEQFAELIDEIVENKIQSYLKDNNYYHLVTGKVVAKNDDRYTIDLGDTFVSDILNKSGTIINIGETVTLMEKAGSNYSSAFILCKNGLEHEIEKGDIYKIDYSNDTIYVSFNGKKYSIECTEVSIV